MKNSVRGVFVTGLIAVLMSTVLCRKNGSSYCRYYLF